jgi:hypothetical protein
MAYESRNAAYDLSLFDDEPAYTSGTAAPKRKERTAQRPKKKAAKSKASKVVTLPEDEINKIRRRKHNPLKLALGSIGGAAAAVVIGIIIVGQVELTELNQDIITAKQTLANTQSIYTENQMKVEANLSSSAIEEYAESVLGMTKASNTQKEFVSLSGGDKAEVSSQTDENLFTQFIDSIQNLWS